ncbi:hypothetical protein T492DRAFT_1133780 [Pavlovales sp. CCMP2436]|nr:hypothetical protein T492DRAFT_1133780 [Pavlovales sp. CCMP2436]
MSVATCRLAMAACRSSCRPAFALLPFRAARPSQSAVRLAHASALAEPTAARHGGLGELRRLPQLAEGARALNRAIMEAPSISHVLCLWEANAAAFNTVHFSTVLSQLARKNRAHGGSVVTDPRFLVLLRELTRQLEATPAAFDERALATVAQAVAKLRVGQRQLAPVLCAVEAAAEGRADSMKVRHLAQLAHAYALARSPAPRLFAAVARTSVRRLDSDGTTDPQALANLAWAFAKAGVPAPTLFGAIGQLAAGRLSHFADGELVMLAWAFAHVGTKAPQLFEALDEECAGERGAQLSATELSLLAWASATLQHRPPRLLASAVAAVRERAAQFDDQALCNVAWALAKTGHADPSTLAAVYRSALPRVRALSPAELSMLAFALAHAHHGSSVAAPLDDDALDGGRAGGLEAGAGGLEAGVGGLERLEGGVAEVEQQLAARLLEALEVAALQQVGTMGSAEVSGLAASLSRAGSRSAPLFRAFSDAAAADMPKFGHFELSSLCRALARVHADGVRAEGGGACGASLVSALAASWWRLRPFGGEELASLAWVSASTSEEPSGGSGAILLHSVAVHVGAQVSSFSPAELASLAVAFAHAGAAPGARARGRGVGGEAAAGGEAEAMEDDDADGPEADAMAGGHGGAEAGPGAQLIGPLMDALATAAAPHVRALSPPELTNLAWAMAKARVPSASLWDAVAAQAVERARVLGPVDVARLAWALAAAPAAPAAEPAAAAADAAAGAEPHAEAFAALAEQGAGCAAQLGPQDLAILASAFACRPTPAARTLFAALTPAATRMLDVLLPARAGPAGGGGGGRKLGARTGSHEPQRVTSVLCAFARAGCAPPELFANAARWGAAGGAALPPRELERLLWAFTRARYRAPGLFEAWAAQAAQHAPAMPAGSLARVAWAYAVSAVPAPALFDALDAAAAARALDFSPQQLAQFAWSSAVHHAVALAAGRPQGAGGGALLSEALWRRIAQFERSAWSEHQRRALWQAALGAKLAQGGAGRVALPPIVESLVREMPPASGSEQSDAALALSLQLRAHGWAHEDEVDVGEGRLVVDMANARSRVALEFDGPSHFLAEPSTGELRADGPTLWKSHVLGALGWHVVRVGYLEWRAATHSREAMEGFLDALVLRLARPESDGPSQAVADDIMMAGMLPPRGRC